MLGYLRNLIPLFILILLTTSIASLPPSDIINNELNQDLLITEENSLLDGSSDTNDIVVIDDIAYIADGPDGLRIAQITNEAENQTFTTISIVKTTIALAVAFENGFVYVADGSNGLVLIDANDINLPFITSTFLTNNPAKGVKVQNEVVYVSTGLGVSLLDGGFETIDVSDPYNPQRLDAINFNGQGLDVIIDNNLAFVVAWIKVLIYDITNPVNITNVGEVDHPSFSKSIEIQNNNIFIVGDFGMKIYDFTNLSNIQLLSTFDSLPVNGITLVGNTAILAGTNQLKLLNVVNKSAPLHYSTKQISGSIKDVTWNGVSSGWVQVSAGYSGVLSVYITFPTDPEIAGNMDLVSDDIVKVVYHNGLLIGGSRQDGVKIYDASDRINPVLLSNLPINDTLYDIVILNDTLYVAGGYDGLIEVDISVPEIPIITLISILQNHRIVELDIFNFNNLLVGTENDWYSASGGDLVLTPVDRAGGIVLQREQESGHAAWSTNGEIHLGTMETKNNFTETSVIPFSGAIRDLEIINNSLYVANDAYGVRVYNITDMNDPEEVKLIDTPGRVLSLTQSGTFVLVADEHGSFHILNASNTLDPSIIASHRDSDYGATFDLVAFNDTIYATDGTAGIDIYSFEIPLVTPIVSTSVTTETSISTFVTPGTNITSMITITTTLTENLNGFTTFLTMSAFISIIIFIKFKRSKD